MRFLTLKAGFGMIVKNIFSFLHKRFLFLSFHSAFDCSIVRLFVICISFAYCLLPTANSFSQSYNFKNYSAEQGLPFVQVYAIFQDSKGNLWTGGYGGLSKFDGKTFTNYSPKNGLANHWVTSISEDAYGNIWIGTINGLSKFDGRSFSTFTKQHGLASDYINSLATDKNENLWIATTDGITIYDGKSFSSLTTKNGLRSKNISLIYSDRNGNIWMNTDSGVGKIVFTNKNTQDKSFDNYSIVNGIYDAPITSITEDANGTMWFGTNNGLVKYDGVKTEIFTTKNGLSDNSIQSVIKDGHSDDIWIGTQKGLNKIIKIPSPPLGGGGAILSFHVTDVQNGNKIGKLFVDKEGNLWLGTSNGLYRFRDPSFATFSDKNGLVNPTIFPIFRDHKKNLWIGTFENGVFVCPPAVRKGDSEMISGKFAHFYGEEGLQVNAGMEDSNGNIWFGTNKGVAVFSSPSLPPSGTTVGYERSSRGAFFLHGRKDGLHGDSVTAIIQDKKGRIWLGGNKGGTIYSPPLRGGAGREGKLKTFDLKSEGQNFDVWYEFEDSKGNIWFGTYLGGVFRYNPKNDMGSVEKAIEDITQRLNLKSKIYLAIDEDRDGTMYLGSFDGVYIYNPVTEKISSISEKDGLSSDLIYVMAFDSAYENLYIGTNQGVNKLDVKEYKTSGKIILKQYGQEEGFKSLETNSNGIWRDEDGTIWFGTVNGLIHLNPYSIHYNHIESNTTIKNIRIFYNDTVLEKNSELPYYLNNISFEYIGICLTNPEKVRYKFMLEGFEKTWSPETKETFAHYSNLSAGRYVFKVMSCNNENLWNKEPATFAFVILPPVWKTWWFRITIAGAVIILMVVFSRLRAEAIRRKEAEKLSREIQLANNELKALRAQMDPHFIFNSLSSIQSFIMTKDEESALRYLGKFAKLMRMILSNSEKSSITLREEIDSLKLYMELEALRWENKFDYSLEVDSGVEIDFHKIPSMLIQPYVENAIIHGVIPKINGKARPGDPAGGEKIEIRVTQTDTHIICMIEDNGIGRKKSQELRTKTSESLHESMGMKITNERLEVLNKIHHSELSANITDLEDEKGNATGTKVEIYIPIN